MREALEKNMRDQWGEQDTDWGRVTMVVFHSTTDLSSVDAMRTCLSPPGPITKEIAPNLDAVETCSKQRYSRLTEDPLLLELH